MAASSHVLVVGGQRSGKSRFAEQLVAASGLMPIYLATAEPDDAEMADRIAAHRTRRGDAWQTIEEPLALPTVLSTAATPGHAILVECLTLWLSNLLGAGRDARAEAGALVGALAAAPCPVVLVSNEVGSGVIPDNHLARRYIDELGFLNQQVASAVGRVFLVVAGLPIQLKPNAGTEVAL